MNRALSDDAIELLKSAADSQSGEIRAIRTFGGLSISAGDRAFETDDRRSEARWESAIEELERAGFVEALSYKEADIQGHSCRISVCRFLDLDGLYPRRDSVRGALGHGST